MTLDASILVFFFLADICTLLSLGFIILYEVKRKS